MLGELRLNGAATASQLGRRLGESSGATSYHLRQLARFGSKAEWPMDKVLDATDELVRLAERVGLPPAGDQDTAALAFYGAASEYLGFEAE